MPILIKDYTWSQNSKEVNIRIPISQVNHEKVDIFTSDSYIKANFNPFLFEVFLLHDVDNKKGKCLIKEDQIVLDLIKIEEQEWDSLEKDLSKSDKLKLKQEILQKCIDAAKQESEDRRIKKTELDRFTVQQAMQIDSKQHEIMDERRNAERKQVMDNLDSWKKSNSRTLLKNDSNLEIDDSLSKQVESGVKIIELPSDNEDVVKKTKSKQKSVNKQVKTPIKSEYVEKKKAEAAKRVLPKMRESAVLEISHTPRTFPTPSRESTHQEEEAWLKNITMARRATGFLSEDLRPEEQDPQWCKEKGDEFFRNGNFLGAISAYSHGIKLSDKLPSLFANRAATHFALGNFNKCVNDCSSAIDLMKPPCESNRRSRAKCVARRAAALSRMGYLSKAIDEMKAAAKLLPEDDTIKKDIGDMERAWEQNPDSE